MAFVHGKGTVISADAKDLSVYGTSCEYELKAEAHDVTTFGNDYKVFSGGLKESSMKIEGQYDDTETDGPRAVLEGNLGEITELIYKPEGAGGVTRTFDGILTQYTETAPVADMIKFEAQFQGSGEVTVAPGTP